MYNLPAWVMESKFVGNSSSLENLKSKRPEQVIDYLGMMTQRYTGSGEKRIKTLTTFFVTGDNC
jgi:hypothetical protein